MLRALICFLVILTPFSQMVVSRAASMVRPVLVVVARIYCVASLKERRGLALQLAEIGANILCSMGVPFARTWRVMTNGDRNIYFIGKFLKGYFPQTNARSVAAAAIRIHQETLRARVLPFSAVQPPLPQRIHREARGVKTDSDADPTFVLGDVINAIRRRPTDLRIDKIIDVDMFRRAFRAQLTAAVLIVANRLLLFGVDGKNRSPRRDEFLFLGFDIKKLCIAIRMFSALVGLAIGLQTIPERLQCPADHKGRKRVANSSESFSPMLQAARYPQQRTHRIAARRRIHDILQIVDEGGVLGRFFLRPPPTRRTRPVGGGLAFSSAIPRLIVLRATPVACSTT